MIALILWQFAKTIGLGRRAAVALIIPCLFFYALITGWKPASIRAATMAGIVLIGMLSSRQPVVLNSLCAAGTGILILSTYELFNPGVQVSFSVVLAIILVAVPLQSVLRKRWEPDAFLPVEVWGTPDRLRHALAGKAAGLAAVSIAAWIGTIPLTAWYFHMVPLAALLANPLAVPLAFVVMVTALLALGGGLASAWIASVFNNANLVFTQALLAVVHFTAALPGATVHLASPSSELRVTVFDFGRGGCAAIECGGELWFLDAGSAWDAQSALIPWMRSIGRTAPDGIVLSHGDATHLGGVEALLAGAKAPVVVDAMTTDGSPTRKAVHWFLKSRGIPISLRGAGETVEIVAVDGTRVPAWVGWDGTRSVLRAGAVRQGGNDVRQTIIRGIL
jgi:ComEC/Rec2-related protein